jgi:hypothetical protein
MFTVLDDTKYHIGSAARWSPATGWFHALYEWDDDESWPLSPG